MTQHRSCTNSLSDVEGGVSTRPQQSHRCTWQPLGGRRDTEIGAGSFVLLSSSRVLAGRSLHSGADAAQGSYAKGET